MKLLEDTIQDEYEVLSKGGDAGGRYHLGVKYIQHVRAVMGNSLYVQEFNGSLSWTV